MTKSEAITVIVEFAKSKGIEITRSKARRTLDRLLDRGVSMEAAIPGVCDSLLGSPLGRQPRIRKDNPTYNEVAAREDQDSQWLADNEAGSLAPVTKRYANADDTKIEAARKQREES